MTNKGDLDTLRMVRELALFISRQTRFLDSCNQDVNEIAKACDDQIIALDALIARLSSEKLVSERSEQARMEQNTGSDGDTLVKVVQQAQCSYWESKQLQYCDAALLSRHEAIAIIQAIRAHFNAPAGEK